MYTKEKDSFVSSNGVDTVACWSYVPERDPKAIVQIAHGMSEHSGRYHAFAEFLVENDILVCANDHLGHGDAAATPEDFGYFGKGNGWVHMTDDLYLLTKR